MSKYKKHEFETDWRFVAGIFALNFFVLQNVINAYQNNGLAIEIALCFSAFSLPTTAGLLFFVIPSKDDSKKAIKQLKYSQLLHCCRRQLRCVLFFSLLGISWGFLFYWVA